MPSADDYRALLRGFLSGTSGITARELRSKGLPVGGRSNALPTMKHGAARKVSPAKGKGADGGAGQGRPH